MLTPKYTRTTITLPEELLWEIKKKALSEKKPFWRIVVDGLSLYLGVPKKKNLENFDINSLFGSWGKGETGRAFLKRVRNTKKDKAREKYLKNLWKKFS